MRKVRSEDTRPTRLEMSLRYLGPLFENGTANASMTSEVVSGANFLAQSLGEYLNNSKDYISPQINKISPGSWELVFQFAANAFESVSYVGNLPQISSLSNIGGAAGLIIGAITIGSKFKRGVKFNNIASGHIEVDVEGEKLPVPKESAELASDLRFRLGLEAVLAFQLLRPGVDAIEVKVGNHYTTVTRADLAHIIGDHPRAMDNNSVAADAMKRGKKFPNEIIRVHDEKVLRFEDPSSKYDNLFVFTDCYREPRAYKLGQVAARQIKEELSGVLYRGCYYNCVVESGVQQYRINDGRRLMTIDALQLIGPKAEGDRSKIFNVNVSNLNRGSRPPQGGRKSIARGIPHFELDDDLTDVDAPTKMSAKQPLTVEERNRRAQAVRSAKGEDSAT